MPLMPTVLKVAAPLDAAAVAVPTTVPPALTVIVTTALLLVTVFPPESRMVTTGCVVNAAPLTAPAAEVVRANCVAVPTVGVIDCVAEVRPVLAKVKV